MFAILYYDVGEERVSKALKICRKYLIWVQNSVFEGEITEAKLKQLHFELKEKLDFSIDSVIVYTFDNSRYTQRTTWGQEKGTRDNIV
ncbi:MAG TPA: CRISPR-associated endonuclease Cas2 [Methanolinea sp.]|nr:CRISPR-associated endonuclease Cas2 [Methanolinea sp.]HQK56084.1 CRISPR-associated endonuclease Cas2 [Methanolinea sp.]